MGKMAILFTAVSLSMDAFAVSVTSGMCLKECKISKAFIFGLYFGAFQFLMPVLGYYAANYFFSYIAAYDHWVAFILLFLVGGKMIYETLGETDNTYVKEESITSPKSMIIMAFATSIDALAIGVSFAFFNVEIFSSSIIIGIVTFILSSLGVMLGKSLGRFFQKSAGRFGGIILILIGLKILMEDLFPNLPLG